MEMVPFTLKLRQSLKLGKEWGSTQNVSSSSTYLRKKLLLQYFLLVKCLYFTLTELYNNICVGSVLIWEVFNRIMFSGQPLFSLTCHLNSVGPAFFSRYVVHIHRCMSECWARFWGHQSDMSALWPQWQLEVTVLCKFTKREFLVASCSRSQWEKHNLSLAYSNHFSNTLIP